ncbi:hypothetical protein [Psychrobacter sp. JCM 18903]|uniref:hypothetical protein n=2 Tax=Psychrobacter sp. JCM 18903 TaxID=1298610 RepID=UPI001919C59A|nr:hypothetical protein [Psychrobacter sp. JCM 18903]
MKKISNEDDLKNYVFNLERENISLKKSHSYRLGKSLIDIKNKILEKDFKGLNPALKNLVDSTQKVDKNQDHAVISISNITESKIKNINSKNTSSTMNYTINSNVYYFLPKVKDRMIAGVFSNNFELDDEKYRKVLLKPDNYKDVIAKSNIDVIFFDLKDLKDNKLWFSFGTYNSTFIMRKIIYCLNSQDHIIKILIENENISLYPLILELKNKNFFNEVSFSM